MNVPQDDLNLWRQFFETLRVQMFDGQKQLAARNFAAVNNALANTASAAARMGIRLERAGADRPAELPPAPQTPLEKLDTPANRRYADALRAAWEAGLEVDRERYGPKIGTDGCAQVVEMVLADVEIEIYGPQGRGEGRSEAGRE